MTGQSTASSLSSSHAVTVSRTNGSKGVVASAFWLVVATGLCFPWLVEEPADGKAGDTPKSVAWYVVLGLDLVLAMASMFSLWFRKSGLTIMLLTWGSACIIATYLMGSFAMLPAVGTMCCCAPEICTLGAADTSALDKQFCYASRDFCMKTQWSLWCFYGGILLAMVAIVLLVNAVAFHHWILVGLERQARTAAKAARASYRARLRRQEQWEQEVYGYSAAVASARSLNGMSAPNPRNEGATTPKQDQLDSLLVARAFHSPSPRSPPPPPTTATAAVATEAGASAQASQAALKARPPSLVPSAPTASIAEDEYETDFPPPISAPASASGGVGPCGEDDLEAASGASGDGGKRAAPAAADAPTSDGKRRMRPWARKKSNAGGAKNRACDNENNAGGQLSPRTALRFKTSALARAIHT